ncbi:hypothetical protein GCM10023335_56280 [Streptomyces siamensis]|uniref:Uncharacterized protein n=1 Tax=Streptomyces siamensis TaxID=1274986 RepID=A0ABP9J9T9_9ACTN
MVLRYGAKSGLSPSRRTTSTQNTAGVPGTAEAFDDLGNFGASTATTDLNRDGCTDKFRTSIRAGT